MAQETQQQLVKFDVCIYKKDEVSEEEFFNWATKAYPVKATALIKKYGIVKWTQTILPAHLRQPVRHTLAADMAKPDWSVPDYDMVTSYWLRKGEDLTALMADPEWAELEVGAAAISNLSVGHIVLGHEIVHFENNNI